MGFGARGSCRAVLVPVLLVLFVFAASACGGGGGLVKQYEYEEDIYLSLDGSATIYVNASIPALVNLRGLDLNAEPIAPLDRARVRALFTSPGTRVARVSSWRRFGRRFIQVRLAVDDITTLSGAAPFAWATYTLDRRDGLVTYRQVLGPAAGVGLSNLKLRGNELVAIRVHVPSRILYHNAGAANLKRGNILVWEQAFAARQVGSPLEIEARFEEISILYSTLMLFAVSGALAMTLLAGIIWWVVRKGKKAARPGAGCR